MPPVTHFVIERDRPAENSRVRSLDPQDDGAQGTVVYVPSEGDWCCVVWDDFGKSWPRISCLEAAPS